MANCPGLHGLRKDVTKNTKTICDGCDTKMHLNAEIWVCRHCDWDLCRRCCALKNGLKKFRTKNNKHICDGCNGEICIQKQIWRCSGCNYDLCRPCYAKTIGLQQFKTNHSNYICDNCDKQMGLNQVMWGCREADYDLCQFCHYKTSAINQQNQIQSSKCKDQSSLCEQKLSEQFSQQLKFSKKEIYKLKNQNMQKDSAIKQLEQNLQSQISEMKHDLEETKQNVIQNKQDIAEAKQYVKLLETKLEEYGKKRKEQIKKLLSKQASSDVHALCGDNKYIKLFYKTIAMKLQMMFFDARVVYSDFVKNELPTNSKLLKGINLGLEIATKVANCIPFAAAALGLVKTGISVGHNLVLETFAKNVVEFEMICGNEATKLIREISLKLTTNIVNEIKRIENTLKQNKKVKQEIEEIALQYSGALVKIFCSGFAETIYTECIKLGEHILFHEVLANLAMNHPTECSNNIKVFKQVIGKENLQKFANEMKSPIKNAIQPYIDNLDSEKLIKIVMKAAKDKCESLI